MIDNIYDFVIIGSGFGGSVAAMRLAEKGYRVLVVERGKRFRDPDFPSTNWNVWKYLWAPAARCYGILQISPFRHVWVLHGSGVGGGSLGYGNVLMQPSGETFVNLAWKHLADWKTVLQSHYATARRMLGSTANPACSPADEVMQAIAGELKAADTFRMTEVGVYFGKDGEPPGALVADPFFGGDGPARNTCKLCGGCMVGCRYNAKNTLLKNYLYFAEQHGVEIRAECEVVDVQPVGAGLIPEHSASQETRPAPTKNGARYEIVYRSSTWGRLRRLGRVRARNVIFAAGTLGTLKLLLRCRDVTRSLPALSPRLGENVRTNSEALLGASRRGGATDFSQGIAITSIFYADPTTTVEPVCFPAGSSLLRFLAAPLMNPAACWALRLLRSLAHMLRHPVDTLRTYVLPGWAQRTTILLVMQTEDNHLRLRLGRGGKLETQPDEGCSIATSRPIAHDVARRFAHKVGGYPAGTVHETYLGLPITAHILGGCPFGREAGEGVVGLDGQIHGYPGLYVCDGSIVPANPGVNPSLTITALAEYVMSQVEAREVRGKDEG